MHSLFPQMEAFKKFAQSNISSLKIELYLNKQGILYLNKQSIPVLRIL